MPIEKIVCISASQVPSMTANSIQVMKVCQSFVQSGYRVHLLVPGDRKIAWDQLEMLYGLTTRFEIEWLHSNPTFRKYGFAWSALRRTRQLKPDALYVWPLQAAVLGLFFHLPILLEMHEPPTGKLGPLLFWMFCQIPGKKRLLPITHALEKLLMARFRIPEKAISSVVVPDGVDLERYQDLPDPEVSRRLLNLPELPTVGYTGHLYPGRGMGLLVELARAFPAVHFLWVGGRPADVELWQSRLKVEQISNVTLMGFIANAKLPNFQAAADILLMPYERFVQGSSGGNTAEYCSPMKMFEYMACGRPIITSDLPVLREVLNSNNAVFCPPEDVEGWKRTLAALLDDPVRRKSLGNQARHDVQAYSWTLRAQRSLEGFS